MYLVTDIPLVGDWNGDGTDGIGIFRPHPTTGVGFFILRDGLSGPVDHVFGYGQGTDSPLVGDWDGQ